MSFAGAPTDRCTALSVSTSGRPTGEKSSQGKSVPMVGAAISIARELGADRLARAAATDLALPDES